MLSSSLLLVIILGLFAANNHPTVAFVSNDSSSSRRTGRGARGQPSSTRSAPADAVLTTAMYMAPKAKKKSTAETIRKKDVAAAVSEQCDLSKADAEAAVSAVFDVISDVIVEGDRVNIAGFGSFEPRSRSARKGRNPKTGEEISIKASTSCGFTAAKQFKERLNGRA